MLAVALSPSGQYYNGHIVSGSIAIADRSSTTIMNAQTFVGAGLSSIYTAVTPAEDAASHFVFQYHGGPGARARLEISNDTGTTWSTLYAFKTPDDAFSYPVCGACQFRAVADAASATATNTVLVTLSGAAVPVAITYTATSTPTFTVTATFTQTMTPTVTPTQTMTPTFTRTATPTNTATVTPTVTPTHT
jgi:hypothetical protein